MRDLMSYVEYMGNNEGCRHGDMLSCVTTILYYPFYWSRLSSQSL